MEAVEIVSYECFPNPNLERFQHYIQLPEEESENHSIYKEKKQTIEMSALDYWYEIGDLSVTISRRRSENIIAVKDNSALDLSGSRLSPS